MILLQSFIDLFVESAPWLLVGFSVAGLIKSVLPEDLLARQLGKPGASSVFKAAVLGAPLPLCSCGVIPAAIGLRRAGASKAATTSFLISTPETGVDSISISYALLGPVMAIARPLAAITSAIAAGLLVGNADEPNDGGSSEESQNCCSAKSVSPAAKMALMGRLRAALNYTFIDLVRDISGWLLLGLLMAATIKAFVPTEFLAQWGSGLLAFIVMAVIGVPMYICATASTPMAAGLLFAGVSPGAVLVFLLVGPATNVATVGLVAKELGRRALYAYLGAVVGVAFLFGFGLNKLSEHLQLNFLQQAEYAHELVNPAVGNGSAIILAALITYSLWRKYATV